MMQGMSGGPVGGSLGSGLPMVYDMSQGYGGYLHSTYMQGGSQRAPIVLSPTSQQQNFMREFFLCASVRVCECI